MAKRNNNNLSRLSSVARSTGEFPVYTFSCCIVLAQGLEFTRLNFVPFFVDLMRVIFAPKVNEDALIKPE